MIIQTGMRTDIPAFYARWFANRLKAGFVLVRNPYDQLSVTRYSLSPDVVDLFAFCTKNPQPMEQYMDLLAPYGQYWFVTITPYGPEIEPGVPDKQTVLDSLRRLSDRLGPDCVGWRYDPIFVSPDYPVSRQIECFSRMAEYLGGYTRTVVISFIDLYEKVKRNFPEVRPVARQDRLALGRAMASIGREYGLDVRACGEGLELAEYGVNCGGCMTVQDYERALGCRLRPPKSKPLRAGCACLMGSYIGAYNTCRHMCRYCYANYDEATVRANCAAHDPTSPFLVGHARPEDRVHQAQQESWRDAQLSLFDLVDPPV